MNIIEYTKLFSMTSKSLKNNDELTYVYSKFPKKLVELIQLSFDARKYEKSLGGLRSMDPHLDTTLGNEVNLSDLVNWINEDYKSNIFNQWLLKDKTKLCILTLRDQSEDVYFDFKTKLLHYPDHTDKGTDVTKLIHYMIDYYTSVKQDYLLDLESYNEYKVKSKVILEVINSTTIAIKWMDWVLTNLKKL